MKFQPPTINMNGTYPISVQSEDEWSPLQAAIIGRVGRACLPITPKSSLYSTAQQAIASPFHSQTPFPNNIIRMAERELDQLASLLEKEGVKVYRSLAGVDWLEDHGYTGALPRDGLMSVGSSLIEACFALPCRCTEIETAYSNILDKLAKNKRVDIIRRPPSSLSSSIFWQDGDTPNKGVINNKRPAFDMSDFLRFGKTILGQQSNFTNQAGMDYIQKHLPPGYNLELIETKNNQATHLNTTILPLRDGLLVYNPQRVTEESLRKHRILSSWDLRPYPSVPDHDRALLDESGDPLSLDALVLDGEKVVVEASDHRTFQWFETLGMKCIPCPFKHVQMIGGSLHSSTVDLIRYVKQT